MQYYHQLDPPAKLVDETHMLTQSRLILIQWLSIVLWLVLRLHVFLDLIKILDSGACSGGSRDVSSSIVRSIISLVPAVLVSATPSILVRVFEEPGQKGVLTLIS